MSEQKYYLPEPSYWPLVGSLGLFVTTFGFASALPNDPSQGVGNLTMMFVGFAILIIMLFGWFGTVAKESEAGQYNAQVDVSFRMGMMWFIFSEVMFFAAFFGALFYVRQISVAELSDASGATHIYLWENFKATWPLLNMPDTAKYDVPTQVVEASGLPLLNTILLLSSSVTVTIAHHALKKDERGKLAFWLFVTVALGFTFLGVQIYEYMHAWGDLNLKLSSGVYGSTFFMLTGFHGFHVFVGGTILSVILIRCLKGHFKPDHHFGFEAAAWYWHFVDVVWVGLYLFVYWL